MSNTEKELKACPFCGTVPKTSSVIVGTELVLNGYAQCPTEDCAMSIGCGVNRWNQRPASPLAEENKRLKEQVGELTKLIPIHWQSDTDKISALEAQLEKTMDAAKFFQGCAVPHPETTAWLRHSAALADTVAH